MSKKHVSDYQLLGASLIWFSACFFSAPLLAAPGDLDTTFGSGGKVISSYGGLSQVEAAVKIQSDGKIVTVGKHYNGHDDDFLVQRFLSNGSPDTTFGTSGATVIKFSSSTDNAKSLDIQSDGKIIIAGGAGQPSSYEISALVRVTANGVLDTSFGNGGKVSIDFGLPSHIHSVVLQSDGKILVTGETYTSTDGGLFAVARVLSSGATDSSFGVDGKVLQAFGTGANAHSLVLQTDGKLLVGGYATNTDTGRTGFLVARFWPDGSLDNSFGTNGSSFVSVGTGANHAHELMLQSDGKIVLSGGAETDNNYDFILVRFNSSGSLDTGFGTNGIVTTNFVSVPRPSREETAGGIIQPDGKIVVGGYSSQKFALARYLPTGALDTSFGTGGMVTTVIGTDNDDWIKSLALQSWDRKIVVVGHSKNGPTFNLAVARFIGDSVTNQVVEFYNANLDNYFITADSGEATAIDGGSAGPGWVRTGNSFKSGGSMPVCRFYGSLSPGPNSHFFTVDSAECQGLRDQQFPAGDPRKRTIKSWNFESLDFGSTPSTNQTCPSGTVPVYRAYNNGSTRNVDSNHRITISTVAIQEVVTRGWSNEGVVMCAPI